MHSIWKKFGPGFLVTAAFIGPGTVTTAGKAGAGFGLSMLWAVVFSVVATIVFQEMAARLGVVTQQGLGANLRGIFQHPLLRTLVLGLVFTAIVIGNAAYQAGNLSGAAIGVESLTGWSSKTSLLFVSAICLFFLLSMSARQVVQAVLVIVVASMSFFFIANALAKPPALSEMAWGLMPKTSGMDFATLMALIGTTVVPYNLFLHSNTAAENWKHSESDDLDLKETSIREARLDTTFSVVLGGLVTAAILSTAAVAFAGKLEFKNLTEMSVQLEPLLGSRAKSLFFFGLTAAGLTSSITAPLAAAFAASGCFGWGGKRGDWRFLTVMISILLIGVACNLVWNKSPSQLIITAQIANGLILPVIAMILLYVMNQKKLMGNFKNGILANCLGVFVLLVVGTIGIRNVVKVLSSFF